jgi:hypothetical protein
LDAGHGTEKFPASGRKTLVGETVGTGKGKRCPPLVRTHVFISVTS